MSSAIRLVLGALVLFIVGLQLIDSMVTGTDTGSVMIQTIGPLLLAVAVVIVLVKIGTGGKGD